MERPSPSLSSSVQLLGTGCVLQLSRVAASAAESPRRRAELVLLEERACASPQASARGWGDRDLPPEAVSALRTPGWSWQEALVLSGAGRAPVALGSVTQASRPGPFCKPQPSLIGALCPGQGFHVPRHLHGMKEMVSPAAEASAGCGQWDARPEGCLLVCCGVRWC